MFKRLLPLRDLAADRSLMLLGPRQAGKTTLVREAFPQAAYINLLDSAVFRDLSARPELFRSRLSPSQDVVIIDEVQRLPILLNEIQLAIDENPGLRCITTGSSARRLKAGGANLLGGRALPLSLHPIVSEEAPNIPLETRLSIGGLPSVLGSSNPHYDLKAYVGLYLQEEVRAEGLTRSIELFSRFMTIAALTNAEQVNFTNVGSDSGIPPRTVREYFQILVDTLIGHLIPPFHLRRSRKSFSLAKFYLFDTGVANFLLNRERVSAGSPEFGKALEHQVCLELIAFLNYRMRREQLFYWREGKEEVDFLIDDAAAIEVKAKAVVHNKDLRALQALKQELYPKRSIVVCLEREPRITEDKIEITPVDLFFRRLWAGEII